MEWVEAGGGLNNSNFRGRVDSSRLDFVSLCSSFFSLLRTFIFIPLVHFKVCLFYDCYLLCRVNFHNLRESALERECVYPQRKELQITRLYSSTREQSDGMKIQIEISIEIEITESLLFHFEKKEANWWWNFISTSVTVRAHQQNKIARKKYFIPLEAEKRFHFSSRTNSNSNSLFFGWTFFVSLRGSCSSQERKRKKFLNIFSTR